MARTFATGAILLLSVSFGQMVAQTAQGPDTLKPLAFLEGTWQAKTEGPSVANSAGTYTFGRELSGHILSRHSRTGAGCNGTPTFDCDHGDLLYVFQDTAGQSLRAIYFDNEGHVIHYKVTTPTPSVAEFLSESSQPGPQFRLLYERKDSVLSGKFQMRMPGQADWKSYLEWSGPKQ